MPKGLPEPQAARTALPMILKLGREELIYAINYHYEQIGSRYRIPPNAEVSVHVPGGGDWSNTDLAIDDTSGDKTVIDVRWTDIRS